MVVDLIDLCKLDAHFYNLVVNFVRSPLDSSDGPDSCARCLYCAGVCEDDYQPITEGEKCLYVPLDDSVIGWQSD